MKNILKNLGVSLTGTVNQNNVSLNSFFKIKQTKKIFVDVVESVGGKKKHIRYNLTPSHYKESFSNKIWSRLSLSQRLTVMKWCQEDYLNCAGFTSEAPSFEYFNNKKDINKFASAKKNGNMYIDLNYISSCSGIQAFLTTIHECIHFEDYQNIKNIFNKYYGVYILFNEQDFDIYAKEIFRLNVNGRIKNFKKRILKLQKVKDEMRRKSSLDLPIP